MFAVPLTFLAVKRTLSETPIKWKETCLHLIFPVVIVALLIVYLPVNAIAPLVGPEMNSTILLSVILWDVSYVLTVCIMGVRYLKKKPSNFLLTFKKNEIKRWVVIFLSFILLMSIGRWVNILSFDKLRGYNIIVLYDISSVFIVLIIIYLLKSPQLIFNDSLGKFNENRLREITFLWSLKRKAKIEKLDLGLYSKININLYISKIVVLESQFDQLCTVDFSYGFVSDQLKIPKTHIMLLFKYHCNVSKSEYKNALKILYAKRLIDNGYLRNSTVDSLGIDVNYKSRITFYKNFKKFIGLSVSDYVMFLSKTA